MPDERRWLLCQAIRGKPWGLPRLSALRVYCVGTASGKRGRDTVSAVKPSAGDHRLEQGHLRVRSLFSAARVWFYARSACGWRSPRPKPEVVARGRDLALPGLLRHRQLSPVSAWAACRTNGVGSCVRQYAGSLGACRACLLSGSIVSVLHRESVLPGEPGRRVISGRSP